MGLLDKIVKIFKPAPKPEAQAPQVPAPAPAESSLANMLGSKPTLADSAHSQLHGPKPDLQMQPDFNEEIAAQNPGPAVEYEQRPPL